MRKMKSLSTFALLLVTALCSALPPLFDNGRSFWSIYADGNTGKHSDFAVKELRETLQKISGLMPCSLLFSAEGTGGSLVLAGRKRRIHSQTHGLESAGKVGLYLYPASHNEGFSSLRGLA